MESDNFNLNSMIMLEVQAHMHVTMLRCVLIEGLREEGRGEFDFLFQITNNIKWWLFLNKSSVIEVLYNHLSYYYFI